MFNCVGLLVNGFPAFADYPLLSLPSDYLHLKKVLRAVTECGGVSRHGGQRAKAVLALLSPARGIAMVSSLVPHMKMPYEGRLLLRQHCWRISPNDKAAAISGGCLSSLVSRRVAVTLDRGHYWERISASGRVDLRKFGLQTTGRPAVGSAPEVDKG